MDVKHLAGFQEGKNRGTFQSDTLAAMARNTETPELGRFLNEVLAVAAGEDGAVLNHFLNINRGIQSASKGDFEGGSWHSDST